MSARSHHQVVRTSPAGTDYLNVLSRAKQFYRRDEKFRIIPPHKEGGSYLACGYSEYYYSKGQRVYEFIDGRWNEVITGWWNEKEDLQ
ncbi:MAG: hypothetical protein J6Y48_06090 [Clostridia bacterium]|nr:hypothetical protein [Clostridia bacterium]